MALISCPECGKRVSSFAPTCPECGYPILAEIEDPDEEPVEELYYSDQEYHEPDNVSPPPFATSDIPNFHESGNRSKKWSISFIISPVFTFIILFVFVDWTMVDIGASVAVVAVLTYFLVALILRLLMLLPSAVKQQAIINAAKNDNTISQYSRDTHSKIRSASDTDNTARCPRCGSTSLSANKKGFGVGKALIGEVLTGGIGLLAGGIGKNKVEVTCLKCGKQFMAGRS